MTVQSTTKSKSSRRRSRSKRRQTLQKPNGVIAPRVKKVGGERFAILCVDPAKQRSERMMADYFGNLLLEPSTVEHHAGAIDAMILTVRDAIIQHNIADLIITVERTGNYHRLIQRAFTKAGYEVRIVHPFATKQYRMPADPGNKTDPTDLFAQHRAAVAGFGLCESPLPPLYQTRQLQVRHRRDLVEKSTAIACQIREHLHLNMPKYPNLFSNFFAHEVAIEVARHVSSPQQIVEQGVEGLQEVLRKKKIKFQRRTIEKFFAGEMGPISHYANSNAITGRSGLFPSRYQSDQTDNAGSIVRCANRRVRAALMRIADNLAILNATFRLSATADALLKADKRSTRVKIAKRFSRIAMACVAGDQPPRHACCQDPSSIIEKLRLFHYGHGTPLETALVDLENAISQLPMEDPRVRSGNDTRCLFEAWRSVGSPPPDKAV